MVFRVANHPDFIWQSWCNCGKSWFGKPAYMHLSPCLLFITSTWTSPEEPGWKWEQFINQSWHCNCCLHWCTCGHFLHMDLCLADYVAEAEVSGTCNACEKWLGSQRESKHCYIFWIVGRAACVEKDKDCFVLWCLCLNSYLLLHTTTGGDRDTTMSLVSFRIIDFLCWVSKWKCNQISVQVGAPQTLPFNGLMLLRGVGKGVFGICESW